MGYLKLLSGSEIDFQFCASALEHHLGKKTYRQAGLYPSREGWEIEALWLSGGSAVGAFWGFSLISFPLPNLRSGVRNVGANR